MKINGVKVKGLNKRLSGEVRFNDKLNVITGPNGSGKTTLLKLCWYVISGNFEHLLKEVQFETIEVQTSAGEIGIYCNDVDSPTPYFRILVRNMDDKFGLLPEEIDGVRTLFEGTVNDLGKMSWGHRAGVAFLHDSLFFPTFRRVEGGFTIGRRSGSGVIALAMGQDEDELTKALRSTSQRLSLFGNQFICSVSTSDVEKLVEDAVARMDSQQRQRYEHLAQKISDDIRTWQQSGGSDGAAKLLDIQRDVEAAESVRALIVEPMRALSSEVAQYFPKFKIALNAKFALGIGDEEVDASILSAGEKQLISFLCYSALHGDSAFMVDEPELSLHLGWQRKLVGSMIDVGPLNQYFFVTHSPAIYSKYSDFEIELDKILS